MGIVVAAPFPAWPRRPGTLRPPRTLALACRLLAPHVLFAATAALLMHPALTSGAVQWQDDTKYFYYPILATIGAALREGRLPLWEPGIFSGYQLFADGEGGMLYPPNLIALWLFEPSVALVALRLTRFYLAASFTFAYLRAIGCRTTAAIAGGLAFMCSGFMAGQVVHENLASGMVWLPLALYFVERSVASRRGTRYRHAAFAGVALAMQALAVHVQVCLFTALTVFPYLGWRLVWRSPIRAHVLDRLGVGLAIGLTTGLVGLGLAAVQLFPLLALAERSARGGGISLSDATINSVTPFRLLTTVFPDLLRRTDGTPFGHWVDWDVAVFVGAPALLFAVLAVTLRRDGFTAYFGVLAASALLLSMGRYGPPWVVAVTRDLLGEHGLRSPGRFAFLWSFGIAALVGLGVDWLTRPRSDTTPARLWFGVVGGVAAGALGGLLSAAAAGRAWLVANPDLAVAWLERTFLAYDPTVTLRVTAAEAYASLLRSLDPAAPSFRLWVASTVGGYALFVGWCLLGSTGRANSARRAARWVLSAGTIVIVAGPLVGAASRAHPTQPVAAAISPDSAAAAFLRSQLASEDEEARPLLRVYTNQAVYLGRTDVEPNTLLPLGVQEAGGYSSLNSRRHTAYAWAAETSAGRMLDVWNARFYVVPNGPQSLPSHELTSFHPERPLVSGSATNAGAAAWFRVPHVAAENVRVVATLRDAWPAAPGAVAAWIVAVDDRGDRHEWPLRVGLEVAEATAADPAQRAQRPPHLAEHPAYPLPIHTGGEYAADGTMFPVHLYYTTLRLPGVRSIVRLGVQPAPIPGVPEAIVRIHGLGAGLPDWDVHNILWHDRERFSPAFADDEVHVYRNETALPRAYLVPLAVALASEDHVKHMAERAFDPERMLFIDTPTATPASPVEDFSEVTWFSPPLSSLGPSEALVSVPDSAARIARSPAGEVRVDAYSGESVTLSVTAAQPAWLFLGDRFDPSWQARVDGVPVRVHLANALFRAVAVPAGRHQVEFRYEPEPLRRGAAVTLGTAGALAGMTLWALAAGVRRRSRRAGGA